MNDPFLLLCVVLFLGIVAAVVWIYRQDRRREHQDLRRAMSPHVWEELEAEREAALARRAKFTQALQDAAEKDAQSS